jgi:hypothetical protein
MGGQHIVGKLNLAFTGLLGELGCRGFKLQPDIARDKDYNLKLHIQGIFTVRSRNIEIHTSLLSQVGETPLCMHIAGYIPLEYIFQPPRVSIFVLFCYCTTSLAN